MLLVKFLCSACPLSLQPSQLTSLTSLLSHTAKSNVFFLAKQLNDLLVLTHSMDLTFYIHSIISRYFANKMANNLRGVYDPLRSRSN